MRTIKYRARVKMPIRPILRKYEVPEGQWVYGEPHTIDCPIPHIHSVDVGKQPIDMETICQYTGLLDINGAEIYEGDVVGLYYEEHCSWKGLVIFNRDGFESKRIDGISTCLGHKPWRIIGNIFDNPELLEKDYK